MLWFGRDMASVLTGAGFCVERVAGTGSSFAQRCGEKKKNERAKRKVMQTRLK